jgi:hypothetical protein
MPNFPFLCRYYYQRGILAMIPLFNDDISVLCSDTNYQRGILAMIALFNGDISFFCADTTTSAAFSL